MATLTASRAAADFPVHAGASGQLMVAYGTYELAANPTAADIAKMCKLPANSVVVGGWIMGDDLDTGAEEIDFDCGWAATDDEVADPDGFGNFGVVTGDVITELKPVAGIYLPLQGVLLTAGPKTFTAPATIQIVFNVDAATGGTGTLSVVVLYTMGMTTG
jgi:hypothetical protein